MVIKAKNLDDLEADREKIKNPKRNPKQNPLMIM